MDSNKRFRGKAGMELNKNSAYCFEQILGEASYKIEIVRPFTSHPINSPNKMSNKY